MMSVEKSEKAPMSKQKKIIIVVVVAIVMLNVLWTLMQNKVASRVDALMGDMAKLEQRITKLEGASNPDISVLMDTLMDAMRDEFGGMKKLSEGQIAEMIKAEETRLSSLENELETQKARVESLKAIAAQEK